ncbi:MAG: signal recognition particle-docking protein FtsY [Deltaproteobacteria bacterium]|nr:signal recognition particle-docking protein FtsY [Deltaproteobacteria bacterium]
MSQENQEKKGFFGRIFGREKTAVVEEAPGGGVVVEMIEACGTEPGNDKMGLAEQEGASDANAKEAEQDFTRLVAGLSKTRSGFIRSLDKVFLGRRELDATIASHLEEALVRADIGVKTAYELLESVTERVKRKELADRGAVMGHLKAVIYDILSQVESPMQTADGPEPFVVMVVGVNGSGKTTTIAKIAARHKTAGHKVLLVAGDTFRAAAVDQIEVWAERLGCPVAKGKDKADPSSVVFEGLRQAMDDATHLVLVDTAGRLHTRTPLMDQLKKIRRTMEKQLPGAPHETLLVIDASTGQNAILQAKTFNEALPITGLALTKLDGASKGGVLVGISNELKIPIRYVGIGEKMDDLRDFNARDFVEALFAEKDHNR